MVSCTQEKDTFYQKKKTKPFLNPMNRFKFYTFLLQMYFTFIHQGLHHCTLSDPSQTCCGAPYEGHRGRLFGEKPTHYNE